MNYSLTLKGAVAMLVAMLLTFLSRTLNLEIPYTSDQVTDAILTLVAVGGFIATYIARYRQGDITWYGKRK
jgi:hypothetical protein